MPELSNKLYYPAFALTMFIFTLAFVPRKDIKTLFWFSLIWGSGVDMFLILLFRLLNLYQYVNAMPFDFYGSPLFINLSWSPAIILFLYFLPKRPEWYVFPLYLFAFGIIGTTIGVFLNNAQLIKEIHWNELFRFPVIVLWFWASSWHYHILKLGKEKAQW